MKMTLPEFREKLMEKQEKKEVITFRIYDMPVELFKEYVAYAKLYFDNQMWKVLEKGMELIKLDEAKKKTEFENRLTKLEDRVASLEKDVFQTDPREREVKTLGKR